MKVQERKGNTRFETVRKPMFCFVLFLVPKFLDALFHCFVCRRATIDDVSMVSIDFLTSSLPPYSVLFSWLLLFMEHLDRVGKFVLGKRETSEVLR